MNKGLSLSCPPKEKTSLLNVLNEVIKITESISDINLLFNNILDMILNIMEVKQCSIMIVNEKGTYLTVVAVRGITAEMITGQKQKLGVGISGLVAQTGRPLLIEDIQKHPQFKKTNPKERFFSNSFICVPLKTRKEVIGVLNINDKTTGEVFTQEDLALACILASQIATTLENAKLYDQMRVSKQRLEEEKQFQFSTLYEISQIMGSIFDEKELLNKILDMIVKLMKVEICSIMKVDKKRKLKIVASRGLPKRIVEKSIIGIGESIAGWVAQQGEPLLVQNIEQDKRFSKISKKRYTTKSLLSMPLRGSEGIIGVLNVNNKLNGISFNETDLETITLLGNQIAIALENARLYKELQETNIKNTELYEAKLRAERLTVLGETITGISHYIKNIVNGLRSGIYQLDKGMEKDDLDYIRKGWETVKRNYARIGELAMDLINYSKAEKLHLQTVNVNEIIAEICDLVKEQVSKKGIKTQKKLDSKIPKILLDSKMMQNAILNCIQNSIEAITERGGRIEIITKLYKRTNSAQIIIKDNGPGISKDRLKQISNPFYTTKPGGTGLGLAIVQKIIRAHRGTLEVSSQLKKGTTIFLNIPITYCVGEGI